MSTIMQSKNAVAKTGLLQGTLDTLVLRTLLFGPAHDHRIAKHPRRTAEDLLQVGHGSRYPALHCMERKRWIVSKWEMAKGRSREFKYCRLTPVGKKQLAREESEWNRLAVATAMRQAPGDRS